jgi:hypothetical protein
MTPASGRPQLLTHQGRIAHQDTRVMSDSSRWCTLLDAVRAKRLNPAWQE